jgi:hypothetical protein
MKKIAFCSAVLLAGCATPQPPALAPGEVYREFTITRSNALGVTPVSTAAIAARAAEVCPTGYRILDLRGEASRRISGVIYTDVDVALACKG